MDRIYNTFKFGTYNALFERIVYYEAGGQLFARLLFLVINEKDTVTENIASHPPFKVKDGDKGKFEDHFVKKFGGTPAELKNVPFKVELVINNKGFNSVSTFELNEKWAMPRAICDWMENRRANGYEEKRSATDPRFAAVKRARKALWNVVHGCATQADEDLIGLSCVDLRAYLTKTLKPAWNWQNYGKIWEIDHIKSLSKARTVEEVRERARFTNLQPLSVEENRKKSNAGV
jgi:hypothetical protein